MLGISSYVPSRADESAKDKESKKVDVKAKATEVVSSETGSSSTGDDRTKVDAADSGADEVQDKDAVDGEVKGAKVTIDFAAEGLEEGKKDGKVKEKEVEAAKKDDEQAKKDDEEARKAREQDRILDGINDEEKTMLKVGGL